MLHWLIGLKEGLLFRVARRWVAGTSARSAIERARTTNMRNIGGIINLLGEEVAAVNAVDKSTEEYLALLEMIRDEKVSSCISVKPSQLGLAVDYELCVKNCTSIVTSAEANDNFMWLDMEGSRYTQPTIDLYKTLLKKHKDVGIAIQAYLKRSEEDFSELLEIDGKIRLCKGAYKESPAIAYQSKREISVNFVKLMEIAFQRGNGFQLAVATHDQKLIDEAIRLSNSSNCDFEFQMLMGIRDDVKVRLASKDFKVKEYIPYGRDWLPYGFRRLRERKRNILLLARSLLG